MIVGLIFLWQMVVLLAAPPPYILPSPAAVGVQALASWDKLVFHGAITLSEIVLGLIIGVALGTAAAFVLAIYRKAWLWLLPALVASQALPVFAIAPLLVLWLGFGMASKVAMAVLIIFFPMVSTVYAGLLRVPEDWIHLAQISGATDWAILRHIRWHAARPAFATGLRLSAVAAPIGAVVGEWVGASNGLGFLMLHANGRMESDMMFAAMFLLAGLAVALYVLADRLAKWIVPWAPQPT